MGNRPRVLIDWDYEAGGVSNVGDQRAAVGWKSWSTVLSTQLLTDLKSWNDSGAQVDRSDDGQGQFRAAGHELAHRVQDELGDGWDVLYNPGGTWAWSWVVPPCRLRAVNGSPTLPGIATTVVLARDQDRTHRRRWFCTCPDARLLAQRRSAPRGRAHLER